MNKPIKTEDILREYQKQLDKFKKQSGIFEPISTILTTHLYVEYFINYIIENHFKLKKKIFSDHRSYTFSIKLDLVYEKGYIPDWLYFNLRKLNDIRNKYSHNLHFDILDTDLKFKMLDDENKLEEMDLKMGQDRRKKNKNRNNIIVVYIPMMTLLMLEAHIRTNRL